MILKGTRDELGCVVIKTGIVETLHAIERDRFRLFIWLTADMLPESSEPIVTTKKRKCSNFKSHQNRSVSGQCKKRCSPTGFSTSGMTTSAGFTLVSNLYGGRTLLI